MNPEPVHEFFDLFVIGEAEDVVPELISAYSKYRNDFKGSKLRKSELLSLLAAIEGIYVPSLYAPQYLDDGSMKEFLPLNDKAPERIRKRFVRDLDSSYYPAEWLVPYIQIVHDRIGIELTRGCPNRCRFCQAREQFYPLRRRLPETVMRIASRAYASSGYEEIALGGLSVSDYPDFNLLVGRLVEEFGERKI